MACLQSQRTRNHHEPTVAAALAPVLTLSACGTAETTTNMKDKPAAIPQIRQVKQ